VNSATQITALAPAGSAGVSDISLATLAGTTTSASAFTYVAQQQQQQVAPTITITPSTVPNPTFGAAYSQTLTASGGTAPYSYAVTSGALPAGLTLNTTGTLSGTPTAGGTFNFTVTATDGAASPGPYTGSQAYTVTVAAPTLTMTPAQAPLTVGNNVAYTQNFAASGGTAPYTYTVITGALPTGLTLSSGGVLTGTSTADGVYNFSVRATDSSTGIGPFTVTQSYTATVAVIPAPTIATLSVATGTAAGGTSVAITGTDLTGTSAVTFGGTAATSFTVVSATQVTAVSPAGSAGAVNVAVSTAGGTATLPAAFTYMAVQQIPPPPTVVAPANVAVTFNSTGTTIDLTSSVSGVSSSIAIATAPANGTTSVAGNVVTYTPTADYYGADSFTFTATGPGGTSAPASVSLNVAGGAPRAAPQTGNTGDNQMVSIELTRGAAVGPFTAATIVSTSPSDAATTRITSTGEGAARRFFLEATAAPRFGGTVRINYTLTNAFGTSPAGVVTLTVAARADPSKDRNVIALTEAQVQATRRFGRSQIANFMRRNEQLHNGGGRSSQNISVNVIDPTRERRAEDMMAAPVMPKRDSDMDGNATATDAPTAPASSSDTPTGLMASMSMWISGAIDIATRDATTFAPKLSANTSGISGGVDFKISKHSAIGFGGGYGDVTTDISGKTAELRASSNLFAVYGSTKLFDNGFLDVVAGHGSLDFKTRRRIAGTELTALGSRTGSMNIAAVSFGINRTIEALDWSLYSKLEYMDSSLAAYVETSGGARNNLRLSALEDKSYSAGLGVRLQRVMETGVGTVTPRLRAEWGREFGKADVQFVDYADIVDAASRSITGRHNEQNYYQTSIGTMIDLKNDWSFDLEYALNYNTATLSSGIKVQVSRAF
jgi:hypothetical protein